MAANRSLPVLVTFVLAACGGGGGGDGGGGGGGGGPPPPPAPPPPGIEPTLESIQENVFTPICTACHAGAGAPQGLRLEEGMSHAMLVNVPSVEVPSLDRVEPGDPDDSYLVQKVEGTAAVGGRMPLGGAPLPADTIAAIRQWITDGAAAAAAVDAASANTTATLRLLAPAPEAEAGRIAPADAPPVAELLVASDRALDATLLAAGTVSLVASGGDGGFSEGNERQVAVRIVLTQQSPTVMRIVPAAPLAADRFRLRISGSPPLALAGLDARSIDGDADGTSGGDFVADFAAGPMR
jgi:hypothetical protein